MSYIQEYEILLSKCVRKYQKMCAEVSMSNKMFAPRGGTLVEPRPRLGDRDRDHRD